MLLTKVSIHTIAHLEAPIRVTSAEISARLAKTLKRIRMRANFLEAPHLVSSRMRQKPLTLSPLLYANN